MRILIAIPHYFKAEDDSADNRSRQPRARDERVSALASTILALLQTFGNRHFGLDHQHAIAWQVAPSQCHTLDIVICTTAQHHLVYEIGPLAAMGRHHEVILDDPKMLGFECHKVLAENAGGYDYYGYVEDDVAVTDPMFFRKRRLFDAAFGPDALLQANRFELRGDGSIFKLYVDYRLRRGVTESFQDISKAPCLLLPFVDETVKFERPSYPSSGCFFLNAQQLEIWRKSSHFLDGDVSYMSALDSAVTLSVMKTFRIYKPVLDQASFLEVRHLSPRWIAADGLTLVPRSIPFATHEAVRNMPSMAARP